MIHKIAEISEVTPSGSDLTAMSNSRRIQDMLRMRDAILREMKEGPYPKLHAPEDLPKKIRHLINQELFTKWPIARPAFAEIILRRPEPIGRDKCIGGIQLLLSALKFAGWIVEGNRECIGFTLRNEVRGEPKIVLDFYLAETDEDEILIRAKGGV